MLHPNPNFNGGIDKLRFPIYTQNGVCKYRKISNISRTKSPNSNVSRLGLQLSLCNMLKPGVK